MSVMLSLNEVVKEYGTTKAVDHASFEVPHSCIFGLLGPNGAGKTSLIRIITGITQADSGDVLLNGEDIYKMNNPSVGYMPEERGLYKKMKVGEQLVFLTRLRGLSREEAERNVVYWMKKFQIESWWNKKVEELSKGMSQKVQFIATVSHNPKLIILDEPFSGLDPINSNLIKDEIIRLANEGASILFSTHRMEQVEEMCQHIVLINKGQIVLNGEVSEVRNKYKENLYEVVLENAISTKMSDKYDISEIDQNKWAIKLRTGQQRNEILSDLISEGHDVISFNEKMPTFNEIFIKTVNAMSRE